jgi:hypothetical protein
LKFAAKLADYIGHFGVKANFSEMNLDNHHASIIYELSHNFVKILIMKRVIIVVLLLLLAFGIYWFYFRTKTPGVHEPKQAAIAQKKHSAIFNNSIDSMVNAYLRIKDAFVEADTEKAKEYTRQYLVTLDSVHMQELKADSSMIYETAMGNISDIKATAQSLLQQTDIVEMRKDFSGISELMYPSLLKTVNYEGPHLYLQNCPMAFNDVESANWISNSVEIVNPYLGKKHPKYKAGMLHCGAIVDTIKATY